MTEPDLEIAALELSVEFLTQASRPSQERFLEFLFSRFFPCGEITFDALPGPEAFIPEIKDNIHKV